MSIGLRICDEPVVGFTGCPLSAASVPSNMVLSPT